LFHAQEPRITTPNVDKNVSQLEQKKLRTLPPPWTSTSRYQTTQQLGLMLTFDPQRAFAVPNTIGTQPFLRGQEFRKKWEILRQDFR
jgi:hypothetical protein